MSSSIKTILIIGGSGGIGEAFARRFHSMGKQVIVTGRRQSKLLELESSLGGLKTYTMDMTDFAALPGHVATIFELYPKIDTVWINGGIQYSFKFAEQEGHSDEKVRAEIDTNITAPTLLARYVVPLLLRQNQPTNFMITSSGLAYIPVGLYPIYCATKAFIHSLLVGLRQQVAGSNLNIIEISPPRVETDLDAAHKTISDAPAMTLQDYTDQTFKILDGGEAQDLKEVAVGFANNGAEAWRGSIGKILEKMQLGG